MLDVLGWGIAIACLWVIWYFQGWWGVALAGLGLVVIWFTGDWP